MRKIDNRLFVSTGAFGQKHLTEILELCYTNSLAKIELGANVSYQKTFLPIIKQATTSRNQQFLIHNYFPPPEEAFVLNLASDKKKILSRSIQHCKTAIDLAAKLGTPFYSVHCGFCFNAEPKHLGQDQTKLGRISKNKAEEIFIKSLRDIADYGTSKGVDLIIENNVAAPFNLIDGKNELLLGVTSEDLLKIFYAVGHDNLSLLLDVGHLKVSAQSLGFSPEEFIRDLAGYVRAIHLSDNDGSSDTNDPITNTSWFWNPLTRYIPTEVFWILEVYNLTLESIKEQFSLITSMVNPKIIA